MRRWPPIVLILALLVGAILVSTVDEDDTAGAEAVDLTALLPVAPPADALDATWFCAGQTAGDDTPADGTVVIANVGDDDARGRLTVVAEGADAEAAVEPVDVPARTTRRIRLADVLEAEWVAATVELDGGTVTVEHEVVGPNGRDVAPCQNRAGDRWTLPSGASTRDATMTLAIFNPFPGSATVDLTFATDDGVRDPGNLQSMSIPARALVVVDVSSVVTERTVIATDLTTRRGQVVVDQIQTFDGEGAATTEEESAAEDYYVRRGLTVTPGVPAPRLVWEIPAGVSSSFVREQVVVANPADEVAEVELTFVLVDPERNGVIEPLPLTVGPGEVATLDVNEVTAVPASMTHSISVRSENGVPVTVDRLLAATPTGDSPYVGTAGSTGSPVAAPAWIFAAGPDPELESGRIAVVNPGDEPVEITFTAFGDGETSTLNATAPGDDVPEGPARLTLAPGARYEVTLADLPEGRTSVRVQATGPVVAERRYTARPVEPASDDSDDESDDDSDEAAEPEPGLGTSTALGIPLPVGLVALD